MLKEYNGRWYLLAQDNKTKELKSYGLDRINNVYINEKLQYFPPSFNVGEFYNQSIGTTVFSKGPEIIKLSLTPFQANYAKSQPLHHSQKIKKETKTEVIITLFTHATPELKIKILGWNKEVKVIEPKWFRDEIINDMKMALENYK